MSGCRYGRGKSAPASPWVAWSSSSSLYGQGGGPAEHFGVKREKCWFVSSAEPRQLNRRLVFAWYLIERVECRQLDPSHVPPVAVCRHGQQMCHRLELLLKTRKEIKKERKKTMLSKEFFGFGHVVVDGVVKYYLQVRKSFPPPAATFNFVCCCRCCRRLDLFVKRMSTCCCYRPHSLFCLFISFFAADSMPLLLLL